MDVKLKLRNDLDVASARQRCVRYRRRILDVSQKVGALHIAPAFSCVEMVDVIYNVLMREADSFLMSKGHGCMIQYVVLEERGILSERDIALYCQPGGRLGAHPDYGVAGIEAATGSLGHGMGIATGMAYADVLNGESRCVFVVLSDGEMQEGSTWEAMMMAANLNVENLVGFLDLNDFQGLGRTSETHPAFYPIVEKVEAFGWEVAFVNGHDARAIATAYWNRKGGRPFMMIGQTVKGKGVAFMENVPIWHYRSPTSDEYREAVANLTEISG